MDRVRTGLAARARYCRGTPHEPPHEADGSGCFAWAFPGRRPAAWAALWRQSNVGPPGSKAGGWVQDPSDRSRHVHPAVHVQRLAGDVGRLRRGEEYDSRRDLLGGAEPCHRNLRADSERCSSVIERVMSVSMNPGASAFTVMPRE